MFGLPSIPMLQPVNGLVLFKIRQPGKTLKLFRSSICSVEIHEVCQQPFSYHKFLNIEMKSAFASISHFGVDELEKP